MKSLLQRVVLERTGPADATVGIISLPLPAGSNGGISIAHDNSATQPIAWRPANKEPRRVLACVVDNSGVPTTLQLRSGATAAPVAGKWEVGTRITKEKLEFTAHSFRDIAQLRGVPADECTTVEFELALSYGGKSVGLQFGSTGPKGGPYYWQNVQIDRLWQNDVAEAVRVGGVIYNEDTYLWADVYLLLFNNGVAHAAAHFVTTKLHIEGYDFQGLPLIRFAGGNLPAIEATTPENGLRFELGDLKLNLEDAAVLAGEDYPGRLTGSDGELFWYPVSRIINPQMEEWPEQQWAPGFARTVRFQFSLSDAAPVIARYRAPSWWYAQCGEPWPFGYLPVHGEYDRLGELTTDHIRSLKIKGRFDGGSAYDSQHILKVSSTGNDGDSGVGMMVNYYHTGRADIFRDALNYCYYWADIHVDHRDFSVRQWVGGWGWKTCAYSKFRDVLFGYLETGDPYLKDTAEMCAEAYWAWFRSNWPRCTIGRDAFEVGAWALLWRYFGTEHARERSLELARMMTTVLDTRGVIGGQMGAGPHPGYLSSLYMTGVSMVSLLEVTEAATEAGDTAIVQALLPYLELLHAHYNRDDVELFPSKYGDIRANWGDVQTGTWAAMAIRIYPELGRLLGPQDQTSGEGLQKIEQSKLQSLQEWSQQGRLGNQLINPIYHDALMLGARVIDSGIEIAPLNEPDFWPTEQTVATPWGDLTVRKDCNDDTLTLRFEAEREFPVSVKYHDKVVETNSQGEAVLGGVPVARELCDATA
jgi:hypothetical protein